jgi:CBS domain containing-hemolysin-like protein
VLDRIDDLDSYIAASRLGMTMATLGLGWIGAPALGHVLHPMISRLPFEVSAVTMQVTSFVVAFSIVAGLHVVLGEFTPRSLAQQRPEETSMIIGKPIHWFLVLVRPILNGLNRLGNQVVRSLGFEPSRGRELVQSAEELMIALDASREAGLVTQTAHDIVDRAFTFTDLQARHVMVPRTEVAALPVGTSLDEVVRIAVDTSYTRLPVFEGDSDHIIGIIKIKRMLPMFLEWAEQRSMSRVHANGSAAGAENGRATAGAERFDLRDSMIAPTLVPETLAVSEVLTHMQENHVQLAVVIDEYGGTAGIVTLQDIVNRLLGRLTEEEDESSTVERLAADGTLHLDGLTPIAELKEEHGVDLADDLDVDTIGGYVFFRLGRAARIGDEVLTAGGERIVVEELDGLRVARVRLLGRAANIGGNVSAEHSLLIPA